MILAFTRVTCYWTSIGLLMLVGTGAISILLDRQQSVMAALSVQLLHIPAWIALVLPFAAYAGGLAVGFAYPRMVKESSLRPTVRLIIPAIVSGLIVFAMLAHVSPASDALAARSSGTATTAGAITGAETRSVLRAHYQAEVQAALENPGFSSIGWSPSWGRALLTGYVYHLQLSVALLAGVSVFLGYFIARISDNRWGESARRTVDAWAGGAVLATWFLVALQFGKELSTQQRVAPALTAQLVLLGPLMATIILAWAAGRLIVVDE